MEQGGQRWLRFGTELGQCQEGHLTELDILVLRGGDQAGKPLLALRWLDADQGRCRQQTNASLPIFGSLGQGGCSGCGCGAEAAQRQDGTLANLYILVPENVDE